jgi:dolichol-phosphate mannosyltransferase
MNLSIIVPCYNEVENITKLHDELLPVVEAMVVHGWKNTVEETRSAEIIFVDDGSRDGTFARLQEVFGSHNKSGVVFKFLKHETNLGLGAAIRTGFSHADGDIVVTVDSDGTYKFSEIPALLARLTPGVDIVTASPYHPEGSVIGVPAYRLILSRGSSLIYRFLVDWHLYTYTCLFRAYRSAVIKNISFESDDFLAGTEILVKALFKGYRAAEFPAVLYKRMYGVSKARIAQTIFSHLKFQGWVFLQRLRRMLGLKPEWIS